VKKPVAIGLGLAAFGAASVVTHLLLGSEPDEPGFDGPLPLCGEHPNCYRVRRIYSAPPDAVLHAVIEAVRASGDFLTGRPDRITMTEDGLNVIFKVGFLYDHLRIAVLPGATEQSVLHARCQSRIGGNDLGLNRLRVRRLLDAVARQLVVA